MSTESSEIVTSLTTGLRQGLTDLHNQIVNDVQGIVLRVEERVSIRIAGLEAEVAELRKQLEERQS